MRVLLSALALTALLLLAGAASVFAADGALAGDTTVTLDPAEPPTTPDTGGSIETVTQTAEPVSEPIVESTAPVVTTVSDAAGPVGDAAAPILDPAIEVVAPVVAPVVDAVTPLVDVVDPVVDVVEPVVSPIVDVVDPISQPILDVVDPVTGPIVDVVEPILDPVVDVVDPVTPLIPGLADPTQPDGVTAPAGDAADILPWGIAASIVAASWMTDPAWPPLGSDLATAGPRPIGVPGDSPTLSTPAGPPDQRAPLLPLADVAGAGSSLSLGAWLALLTAGLLAIVFHASRRPWSSVPILRGRSLLPALAPA